MARHFEALAGIRDRVADDPQHRQIGVEEVVDIDIAPISAEHRALRQFADRDLADFGYLPAGDLEDADYAVRMVEPAVLGLVRALRIDCDGDVALRAD